MFSTLNSIKVSNFGLLNTINELYNSVKENSNKDLIEKLRSLEYKSKDYDKLKLKLPAIKTHGVFNGLTNNDLVELNGYMYFDIDNVNDTWYEYILEKYSNYISLLCKSIGGKGYSFFVKVDGLTIENHRQVYLFLANEVFNLLPIDMNAYSLNRNWFVSYDENCYINKKVSFSASCLLNSPQTPLLNTKTFKDCGPASGSLKENYDALNDTFFKNIIPFKLLQKQLSFETRYGDDIKGDYIVHYKEYHKAILPKEIKDGSKHKVYSRLINSLYYLNNDITKEQIFSLLYYINENRTDKKMKFERLVSLVKSICEKIETDGVIICKTRQKPIWFDPKSKLSGKDKRELAPKIMGVIRTNKTIDRINDAKDILINNGEKVSQNRVLEITGLSIATIKRNWNKCKGDINMHNKYTLNEIIMDENFIEKTMEILT